MTHLPKFGDVWQKDTGQVCPKLPTCPKTIEKRNGTQKMGPKEYQGKSTSSSTQCTLCQRADAIAKAVSHPPSDKHHS